MADRTIVVILVDRRVSKLSLVHEVFNYEVVIQIWNYASVTFHDVLQDIKG